MNQNDDKAWRITEIIGGTVVALLGLFALLFPDFLSGLVSILIGAGVLVIGITQIVTSVKDRACLAFPAVRLALGVILAAVGLVFICGRSTPVSLFGIFLGVWALVSGSLKLNAALLARRAGGKSTWQLAESVINLLFGAVLIVNPLIGVGFIIRIIGGYLVYLGIAFVISVLMQKNNTLL